MKIKICGITNLEDAIFIENAGADFEGFIFEPDSPRYIELSDAVKISEAMDSVVKRVGVFVSQKEDFIMRAIRECGLSVVQLHGNYGVSTVKNIRESGIEVWKTFWPKNMQDAKSAENFECDAVLCDAKSDIGVGGTGKLSNWSVAREISLIKKLVLAGGLNLSNAEQAAQKVSPWCLDFNSGVEISPRKKDKFAIQNIIEKLK